MKARKCPASRNCIAWSGTMKLNRICFSEIASRMIKGAAGRRWWSPFTEATSVTPSLTPYVRFVFFSFARFLKLQGSSPSPVPFHRRVVPLPQAWRWHQGSFKEQGSRQHHSLGSREFPQMHQVLRLPLTITQRSAFPCSLIIAFWVKIWPFSFAVNSSKKLIRVTQHLLT